MENQKKKLEEASPQVLLQDVMVVEDENGSMTKEIPIGEPYAVTAGEPSEDTEFTKWIRNEAEGTKKCESCGAVMRGWAYREPFAFCPKCGKQAEKAI